MDISSQPHELHFSIAEGGGAETLATVFRGDIRQLAFTNDGRLLALVGRGLDVLDATTLEDRGRWLDGWHVDSIEPVDERFAVLIRKGDVREVHLLAVGEEPGEPLVVTEYTQDFTVGGAAGLVAVPNENGLLVHGLDGNEVRRFALSAQLEQDLRRKPFVRHGLVSPDGAFAVGLAPGDALGVWSVETGEQVLERAKFDAPDEVCFLPDGRLVAALRGRLHVYDFAKNEPPATHRLERGTLVQGGGRLLVVDCFGSHREIDTSDFSAGARREFDSHYGSLPSTVAAVAPERIAAYAGSYGKLRLHYGDQTVERDGYLTRPEGLSVSADGRRFVVATPWRNEALAVDLDAATVLPFGDVNGTVAPAVSKDGARLVFGGGSNTKPRTIKTGPFHGEEPSEQGPKILAWARRTQTFGDDLYALNTYKLSSGGHVAVYRFGSTRAVMKLKEGSSDALQFAINRDGNRALVAWSAGSGATLHDLEAKGAVLRRWSGRHVAVALGRGENHARVVRDGEKVTLAIEVDGEQVEVDWQIVGFGLFQLCFNEDASLLYVGMPTGEIEVRRTVDGEVCRTIPQHAGPIVRMEFAAGLLWSLGEDGFLRGLGVPSEAAKSSLASTPSIEGGEPDLAPMTPWKPRHPEVTETPEKPDATSVEPFRTDWAKTQNETLIANLRRAGFVQNEESAHALMAMELYAPGIGIAVVALDEEHGCSTLSFHAWNGTREGGGLLKLGDVDPLFYSEAYRAVREAYSDD